MVLADRVHVVEGIDFVELAGVEDGHEQVAKPCTDPGFVEQGVLPMEDRLFEGPLAGIVIALSRTLLGSTRRWSICSEAH